MLMYSSRPVQCYLILLDTGADIFPQTVVQLSTILKSYGSSHPLSSVLRNNMVELTNATEELVILLHVSSFSSPYPRSHSPMVHGVPTPPTFTSVDDGRLGASLSRSRSAQGSVTPRLMSPMVKDMPHSALPSQSFKISTPPRRIRRVITEDGLDGV